MAIELVDLPINSMVIFPYSYVSLPEGILCKLGQRWQSQNTNQFNLTAFWDRQWYIQGYNYNPFFLIWNTPKTKPWFSRLVLDLFILGGPYGFV